MLTAAWTTTVIFGVLVDRLCAQATPGGRASGMADAFVAVADDGSAVYWNPAGLVSGPFFNLQGDLARLERNADGSDARDAVARGSAALIAASTPPFGVGYYSLRSTEASAPGPAEADQLGREKEMRGLHRLTTHHIGVTVLQSLVDWLTVGVTAKLVVGVVGGAIVEAPSPNTSDWLEAADRLDTETHVRGDVDVGAMVDAGRMRVGLVARNLTEPEFGNGTDEVSAATLDREVRLGAAWGSGWPDQARVIIAADVDLTRRAEATAEERRDVAAGIETWWRGARVGLRSGVRASTVGEARPIVTGGASFAVTRSIFVDGYVVWGSNEDRGWGLGVRLAY
jgi:hypothetical protein